MYAKLGFETLLETFRQAKKKKFENASICYTIQLMHYSHFKTHSLQHLKPIKC